MAEQNENDLARMESQPLAAHGDLPQRATGLYRRWFLIEFHPIWCACSICDDLKNTGVGAFGFLAPIDKSWNAWRWLFWVRTYGIRYVRWTGFWKRGPQASSERTRAGRDDVISAL